MSRPAPNLPPPSSSRWTRADATRLVREVLIAAGAAIAGTLLLATGWSVVFGGAFIDRLGPSGLVVAALLTLGGPLGLTHDARVSGTYGKQSWSGRPGDTGAVGLTPLGLFLFVAIPLAIGSTMLL